MFGRRQELLSAEIKAHIEAETELNLALGMTREEAYAAACKRFGNVALAMEDSRAVWIPQVLEQTLQDLQYGLRTFQRNSMFAIATVVVIAAGIGASTAVFSFLHSVFVRKLPYAQPERLATVGIAAPILDFDFLFANDYLYLRQSATPFKQLTSWTGVPECDVTEDRPQTWACAQVEATFLPTLGIRPLLGRNFTPEEDRPESPKVALISFGIWKSRFGSNPNTVGHTISLDGNSVRIIGVLPSDFEFPSLAHVDLLVPQTMALTSYAPNRTGRALHVLGRLKERLSPTEALQKLKPFFQFQLGNVPPNFRREIRPVLRSLRDSQVGSLALAGEALTGATGAILLIVIANVGGLLMARGFSRSREFAIRSSLGAGPARIARQLLVESLLLSLTGGLLGCALAALLIRLFKALAPTTIPHIESMALRQDVLLFALGASVIAGVVFALAASLPLLRPTTRHEPIRPLLVAGQIAISLVLLCVSCLLLQSLNRVQHLAFGLQSEHVLVADISLAFRRYPNAIARQNFVDSLMERLRAIPGTSAVAFTDTVPPAGFVHDRPYSNFVVNGRPVEVEGTGGMVAWRAITPDYFRALSIPCLSGRTFSEADRASQDDLLVLSNTLSLRLFGHRAAPGAIVKAGPQTPAYRVIGIVGDVRNSGLAHNQQPEYYVLRKRITDQHIGADADIMSRSVHFYDGKGSIVLRSSGRSDAVANAVRDQLQRLDPTTPVAISSLDDRLTFLREGPRFSAVLMSGFAAVALLLASTGLYGLTSYMVAQRRKEVGVRFALGATRQQVLALILQQALRWALPGMVVGLLVTLAATRWLEGLLFEVKPLNPVMLGVGACVMLAVVIGSAMLPGWRAAQVDPLSVLRQD